jgi:hypothetical protein
MRAEVEMACRAFEGGKEMGRAAPELTQVGFFCFYFLFYFLIFSFKFPNSYFNFKSNFKLELQNL